MGKIENSPCLTFLTFQSQVPFSFCCYFIPSDVNKFSWFTRKTMGCVCAYGWARKMCASLGTLSWRQGSPVWLAYTCTVKGQIHVQMLLKSDRKILRINVLWCSQNKVMCRAFCATECMAMSEVVIQKCTEHIFPKYIFHTMHREYIE